MDSKTIALDKRVYAKLKKSSFSEMNKFLVDLYLEGYSDGKTKMLSVVKDMDKYNYICSKCNAPVNEIPMAKYCWNCGYELSWGDVKIGKDDETLEIDEEKERDL